MNLVERAKKVLSPVQAHYTELEIERGSGSYLITHDGRKILDFASGVAVTNTGHCHPAIVKAATEQMNKIIHNCAAVTYTDVTVDYAEKLTGAIHGGPWQLWFCQSGTETIEASIKCAKAVSQKPKVIALEGGFHGRTYGAMSLTSSNEKYTNPYKPLVPELEIMPRDIKKLIKDINPKKTAAILTELVIGEGGYVPMTKKFVQELRQFCSDSGILLILDEIQTGFGRTGKLFAFEHYDILPDIMALSKSIASGFPLGACVIKKELSEKWETSTHGGTFLGNPVALAAASATLDVISREIPFLEEKSQYMFEELSKLKDEYHKHIIDVRGLGLMIGVECKDQKTCDAIRKKALEKEMLMISCGSDRNIIRLIPPLTITLEELKQGMHIFKEAVGSL